MFIRGALQDYLLSPLQHVPSAKSRNWAFFCPHSHFNTLHQEHACSWHSPRAKNLETYLINFSNIQCLKWIFGSNGNCLGLLGSTFFMQSCMAWPETSAFFAIDCRRTMSLFSIASASTAHFRKAKQQKKKNAFSLQISLAFSLNQIRFVFTRFQVLCFHGFPIALNTLRTLLQRTLGSYIFLLNIVLRVLPASLLWFVLNITSGLRSRTTLKK